MNTPPAQLIPIGEYTAQQWDRFVTDLTVLITTGYDDDAFIEHRRTLHGICPREVEAAKLDARLRLEDRQEAA